MANGDPPTTKTHFYYIVGILVAFIVLLATFEWAGIKDLASYFTFAMTLTSLILAILAILYSFLSSSGLASYVSELRIISKGISSSTDKLGTAATEIRTKVEGLDSSIQEFGGDMKNLLNRNTLLSPQQSDSPSETSVKIFLKLSSLLGLQMLYAASRAHLAGKPLELDNFEGFKNSKGYLHGFMVAAYASGIVEYSTTGDGYVINSIHNVVNKTIKAEVLARIRSDKFKDHTTNYGELLEKLDLSFPEKR